MVFHDAVTEHDEAISSEQSELREQIPSARSVREPDKEQAETELEHSVRESLAARQQSDPEIGTLVRMRTSKTLQLQRRKGAKTMTVHIDRVNHSWVKFQRAGSPASRAPTSESSLKKLMKRYS